MCYLQVINDLLEEDLMNDSEKLVNEIENQKLDAEPITYQGLKSKLIKARMDFLKPKDNEDKNDSENNDKPAKPKLDTYDVAKILYANCHFCMFKHGSNARLATYDVEKGIYTYDYSRLRIYISYVAPRFGKSTADTVIYHLINMVGAEPVVKRFSDPELVPVGNGIYEPKTNTLYPFSSSHFITSKIQTCLPYRNLQGKLTIARSTSPVTIEKLESPKITNINGSVWDFDSWLMTIADNDAEIYKLLWQVIVVACNTNIQMNQAIFLLGKSLGNNGKGTFQALIQNMVGEDNYAMKKINQFQKRFALDDLVGKSVVIGDDNPTNVVIDDKSDFNSIVTNDPVSVEPKGEKAYTTKLNLTVIQSCNAMPRFKDDGGVYRRMVIVPFNADFNGQKENKAIKNNYLANRTVLQYVLYHALNQKSFESYSVPAAAIEALEKYEHVNNPISSFIDDVFENKDGYIGLKDIERLPMDYLYGVWKTYAKENNYHDVGRNTFNQRTLDRVKQLHPNDEYNLKREKLRREDCEKIKKHQSDDYCYTGTKNFTYGKTKTCLEKLK